MRSTPLRRGARGRGGECWTERGRKREKPKKKEEDRMSERGREREMRETE